MSSERPTCATCPHYWRIPGGAGQCRRYPPRLVRDPRFGDWPEISDAESCGEHPRFIPWMVAEERKGKAVDAEAEG